MRGKIVKGRDVKGGVKADLIYSLQGLDWTLAMPCSVQVVWPTLTNEELLFVIELFVCL